jgi:hypothetical protein
MQQPDLFAEPLVEPLAAYVARRTGCNMKFLTNQITLARWVERLGEDHVRKRLESTAHPYPRVPSLGW